MAIEQIRTKGKLAYFVPKAHVLDWPEHGSVELMTQYLTYSSPTHKIEIARQVAETLLFEAVSNPWQVGLVGSMARGTADEGSDIDMPVFLDDFDARRFSFQGTGGDYLNPTPIRNVFGFMKIEERKILKIVEGGLPDGTNEDIKLTPIDLHLLVLPRTADRDCIEINKKLNGERTLSTYARDLLIYDPTLRDFTRPSSHWLFDFQ